MPTLKFDTTLNWSTILSIVALIGTIIAFGWNIRSGQAIQVVKTDALITRVANVETEVGEIRRLHLAMSNTVQDHSESIDKVTKVAKTNSLRIKDNTLALKEIPELLSEKLYQAQPQAVVAAEPPKPHIIKAIDHNK